jgi:hypothetical protein
MQYPQLDMPEEDWGQSKFQWGGELGPTPFRTRDIHFRLQYSSSVYRHLLSDFIPSFSDHSGDATLARTPADSRRASRNSSDQRSRLQAARKCAQAPHCNPEDSALRPRSTSIQVQPQAFQESADYRGLQRSISYVWQPLCTIATCAEMCTDGVL